MSDDVTYDVIPWMLREASRSIGIEKDTFGTALTSFKGDARELKAGQGWLDAYNDVIQDILRATEDAIGAFEQLVANLGGRSESLLTTATNYERTQAAARQRYGAYGGGS